MVHMVLISGGEASGLGSWAAKSAGAKGNNLKVAICTTAAAYQQLAKSTMDTTKAAGVYRSYSCIFHRFFSWRYYLSARNKWTAL